MFWAIIKEIYEELINKGSSENESKEKSCYNSAEIIRNWSKEQIDKFTFWDCSGIKSLITDKKVVSFIREHERIRNLEVYSVRDHFRLKAEEKLSYNKKDDRHTTAQHILAGLIFQGEPIKINYRNIPFRLNDIDLNIKNKTSDHILEQCYIEKELGINRRADLLFELNEPNLTFGKGIVFEIMNNEDYSSIKEKSKDWAKAGYSLVAIPISNFNFEDYSLKKENYLIMYRLFDDINIYLEILQKIKQNEPLIDNFNKNVREMENKMFLWRTGRHNYKLVKDEKVNSIYLFCFDFEVMNLRERKKYIFKCYDYSNKLIDVDLWNNNPLCKSISRDYLSSNLIKIENAYFKEYLGEISLCLNKYSKINIIKVNKGEDQKCQ